MPWTDGNPWHRSSWNKQLLKATSLSFPSYHLIGTPEHQKYTISSRWLWLPLNITISWHESIQDHFFPLRHSQMHQIETLSSVCQVNINMNSWGQRGNLSFYFPLCYASAFEWFVYLVLGLLFCLFVDVWILMNRALWYEQNTWRQHRAVVKRQCWCSGCLDPISSPLTSEKSLHSILSIRPSPVFLSSLVLLIMFSTILFDPTFCYISFHCLAFPCHAHFKSFNPKGYRKIQIFHNLGPRTFLNELSFLHSQKKHNLKPSVTGFWAK